MDRWDRYGSFTYYVIRNHRRGESGFANDYAGIILTCVKLITEGDGQGVANWPKMTIVLKSDITVRIEARAYCNLH